MVQNIDTGSPVNTNTLVMDKSMQVHYKEALFSTVFVLLCHHTGNITLYVFHLPNLLIQLNSDNTLECPSFGILLWCDWNRPVVLSL